MNDDRERRPDDEDAPEIRADAQTESRDEASASGDAARGTTEREYRHETDDVVTGEVVNIKPYGAFVQLPDGETGLVHISEVDEAYVKDVGDYLAIGQEVAVKVVGIHDSGKYNLSIRQISNRERDSAFYSREMREFSRELELRREEIHREARWRQTAQGDDERPRLSHEAERAELEAWIETAREVAEGTRRKSEERARAYPLL